MENKELANDQIKALSLQCRKKSVDQNEAGEKQNRRLSLKAYNVLDELRRSELLCDARIQCDDGVEFVVHRAILSGDPFSTLLIFKPDLNVIFLIKASSEFFRALFTSGLNQLDRKVLPVSGIDSDIMKLIIGTYKNLVPS